eukprot:SAG31_NODE_16307_length_714_cov_0.826016_1_plen_60_part_10
MQLLPLILRAARKIGVVEREIEQDPSVKAADRVAQVRSYFLVFVPTIREIRDFYREMQRT